MVVARVDWPAAAALAREVCSRDLVNVRMILLHTRIDDDHDHRRAADGDVPSLGTVHVGVRDAAELAGVMDTPATRETRIIGKEINAAGEKHVRLCENDFGSLRERIGG